MTAADRFDRLFADMLADVAQPAYPDYIDDALDLATRGSQRPAWTFPERWLPMTSLARTAPFAPGLPVRRLLAVAIIVLLAAALAIVASGVLRNTAPPYGLAHNGLIAYEVEGDIFTRDPADGTVRLLVGGNDSEFAPTYSLDGTMLAFARADPAVLGTANEALTVVVANADGSEPRTLAGPGPLWSTAWSPTNRELAFLTDVNDGSRISIVGVDGSRRDLELDVFIEGPVQWRPPDGRELIFKGRDTTIGYFAVRPDGTGLRRIPITGSTVYPEGETVLTPDGSQLVYRWFGTPSDIRIVDIDSGAVRTFGAGLPVPDGAPAFRVMHLGAPQLSADGKKLVFGRYWDERDDEINHQIWVASLAGDGEDAVPVSPVVRSQSGINPFAVILAPDGSQIIVHQLESNVTWVTDGDGGNRRQVDWGQLFDTNWQRTAN